MTFICGITFEESSTSIFQIAEGFPVVDCSSHIVPVHIGDAQKAKLCMEMLFEKHKIYVQVRYFLLVVVIVAE